MLKRVTFVFTQDDLHFFNFSNIHDAIMSVLSSKENTSKDMKTDEVDMGIQQKCLQQGVYYIEGKKEKNKYECRKRR